jgi:opacity protein-like surface antigen
LGSPVAGAISRSGVLFKPTLAAGLSYRRLARFSLHTAGGSGGEPAELTGRNAAGATVGGGVEVGGKLVRLSAEIRYTRWGSSSIRSAVSGLATQLNQADFLLGIMF